MPASTAPPPILPPLAGAAPADREAARAARWALFVLTLINLFNYLDRYVPAALVESLRKSELHISDTQSGMFVFGFLLVFMVASPIFGLLGDKRRRPPILAIGIAVWSVATALGGFARSFATLFVARSMVGVGEAAYVTISPPMLADSFPRPARGRVFAIFNAAIPVGAALGFVLGGLINARYGWRAAFFVAGVPGLVLALLAWRLADPPRGGQDEGDEGEEEAGAAPAAAAHGAAGERPKGVGFAVYLDLWRGNRAYRLVVLGYAAYTFALGALGWWMPAFLQRERGMTGSEATTTFGLIAVVTGFLGTFAGGWLGDYLLRRHKEAYLWVSGIATLLAAPAAFVAFVSTSRPVYISAIVVAELLIFVSTGPIGSALVNVVSPGRRAAAMGLNTMVIHLLGDAPSPLIVGWVSDHSSLSRALLLLPVAIVVSGLIWCYAAWSGPRHAAAAAHLAA